MSLHKLVRRNYGRKFPVSIKYQNLHSFKEGIIHLYLSLKQDEYQIYIAQLSLQSLKNGGSCQNCLSYVLFSQKNSIVDVSQVLSLLLTTINQQQKSYITIFWNGGSYYHSRILPVQRQQ